MVRTRRGFIIGLTSAFALIAACKSSSDGGDAAPDGGTNLPDAAGDQDATTGGDDSGTGDPKDASTNDDAQTGDDASADDAGTDPDDAGSDDAGGDDDAATSDPMTLTSPAVVDGRLAKAQTCDAVGGASSPALSWTAGPAGTLSYAVVMTDISIPAPAYHWVIYDIPAGITSLAAGIPTTFEPGVPAGAKQAKPTWGTNGFFNACPQGDPTHDYVFTVYALKTAKLGGVNEATAAQTVEAAIKAQKVNAGAEASLTAKYTKEP